MSRNLRLAWWRLNANENQILSEINSNNNNKQTLPDIVLNGFKCTFFLSYSRPASLLWNIFLNMLLSTPRLDITLQDCVTPGDWGGTHWDYNVDAHWNYTNCLLDYWSLAAWAYYHDCSTLAHSSTCSILLFAFVRYRARSDSYESNHARKVLLSILLSSSTVPTLVYLWTLCRTERRNPELLRKKQTHLKRLIASL